MILPFYQLGFIAALNLQGIQPILMSIIFHHYEQLMQFTEQQIKAEENYLINKRNQQIQYEIRRTVYISNIN